MATSWSDLPGSDDAPRRRVSYPSAFAVSLTCGAAGEVAFRTLAVLHGMAGTWQSARLPLVALLTVVVAQVPVERRRRHSPRTQRPGRSELARHLERRVRRAED